MEEQVLTFRFDHDQEERLDHFLVEKLPGLELDELMARVRSMPPVPLAPHADTEITRNSIAQLLRDAARGRRELGSVKRPRSTPDS